MKIKSYVEGNQPFTQGKIELTEPVKAAEIAPSEAPVQETDTVTLSEEARLRGVALAAANQDSGIRADKVAELKAQIQAGTYKPDLRKTAANMLRDDLDLTI